MQASKAPAKSDTADRQLVFNRTFNAPPGVVFEVWTNPAHLPNWWGPHGFRTTIHEMDVRPGGVWRLTMRGPDGRDYHNRIVFIEVDKPRRLVYKHEREPGSEPVNFEITVTFEHDRGKTNLTMRMLFPTAADRDFVINTYHADEGGEQTLDRLAGHLKQIVESNKHLVMTRIFDAPRDLVFKAWTDPKHFSQWWGPHGFTNPVCELDVRPGGKILIHMRAPNGLEYPMYGSFVEIVEPERLIFISGVKESDGSSRFEVRNTLTFKDCAPGKTELTLDILVISSTEAALGNLAGAKMGWAQTLDRLTAYVETQSGEGKS
jgi:uncharacterized protein YndB with AHSA1/START domain